MSNTRFVGVVLAGGKSSRMGQDKALLEFSGNPLLDHAKALLLQAGASNVLISRNNKSNKDFLGDIHPGCGPISGIHAAMTNTDQPLLIVPVDMPMLSADMLRCLVEMGLKMENSVHYEGFALPLFLWNNQDARRYLTNCLTKSNRNKCDYSVMRFISAIGCAQITCHQQHRLINTNTPQEWQKLVSDQKIVSLGSYRKKA